MPDYYDVIKNPRDLGTIKKNLIRKKYESPQEFYEVPFWLLSRESHRRILHELSRAL